MPPPPPQLPGPSAPGPTETSHRWEACSWEANGERQCLVCGCSEVPLVRADMEDRRGSQTGKKSRLYHYRDARGNTISSLIPLACPVYLGDVNGAVGEAKQRIRNVTGRVDTVEGRVEGLDARLARLEAENEALRAQVQANQADVGAFVQWLGQMVAEHSARGLPAVTVGVSGREYRLPPPVASVITAIGAVPDTLDAEVVAVTPAPPTVKKVLPQPPPDE